MADMEDLQTVCAALVVYHLPAALAGAEEVVPFGAQSASGPSQRPPPPTTALEWAQDDQAWKTVSAWLPAPVAAQRKKKLLAEQAELAKQSSRRSALYKKFTQDEVRRMVVEQQPVNNAVFVGQSLEAPVGLEPGDYTDEKKEDNSGAASKTEAVEGRVFQEAFQANLFLGEAESVFHGLMLQEYYVGSSGVVTQTTPIPIHAGQMDSLLEVLRERATLESDDEDWRRSFREFVFEHSIPLGARALNRRGVVSDIDTQRGGPGSEYLQRFLANAKPIVLFEREVGSQFAVYVDTLIEDARLAMSEPDHELHDLFILHFFAAYVYHETVAMDESTNTARGADFLALYYLGPHHLERHAELLLRNKLRYGERRRPLLVYIRRRWMVHDFVDMDEKTVTVMRAVAEPRDAEDEDDAELTTAETVFKQSTSSTDIRADVFGVWYDFEDDLMRALVFWLLLVKTAYNGYLEDGTEMDRVTDIVDNDNND